MAAKKKTSKKSPAKAKKGKARGGRPSKGSGPSKSEFIREKIKAGLSAAEIVKAGAEQKMTITPAFIYKIKSRMGAGSGARGSKPGPKPKDGKVSASDFVRQHPGKSASEVVELAKKAGVKVNAGLVYTVRAYDKKRGSSGGATAPRSTPGPKPKGAAWKPQLFPGTGGGSEADLKKAALAVGFPRALQVVEELSKKFRAVEMQYQALLG